MKLFGLILLSVATLVAALAPAISPGQASAAAVSIGSSPLLNIYSHLQARSKVDPKCTSKQKKDIKQALEICRKIAKAAAAAARTGNAERLETYFHTSDQAYRNRIAAVYDEIAQECKDGEEGQLTITCEAPTARCPDDLNRVAYHTKGVDTVTLCPAAFARPIKPKRCGDRSLAGVFIHEFSHALAATPTVDHAYGRYDSTQLSRDRALANADSYQWFAIDVYLNCPRPTPPPTSQIGHPSTSREDPADQDINSPQYEFPEFNQTNVLAWANGVFHAFSCASITALFKSRRNKLRALNTDDCRQARQLAASYIQTQRQLENMDFDVLQIPDASRPAQASDFMMPAQCARVMKELSGMWHKQEAEEDETSPPQCTRLAEEVTHVEPSACNITYILVDILLADEPWAGTDHMLDLVLYGKFARSASQPIRLGIDMDRGWRHTRRINLQEEFNAETISFKNINGLQLWSGKDELWVEGLWLRGRCALSKEYISVDRFAGLNAKMSAKEWSVIWYGEIKPEDWGNTRCEQIDRLELDIHLKDEAWAGTDDALDLLILGEFIGKTSHTIRMGRDMNRKWEHRQKITMSSLNGPSTFTGASHITGLELRSASNDDIKLQSIKVTARCTNPPIEAVIKHKWESINQWVKPDRDRYGKIWHGAIEAKDWSWRPPCYEFDELKVALHLADARWAGTDGLIQVNFDYDLPKITVAENPNRDHRATIDINLDTVFGKKVISISQIKHINIWTGTDEIYVDSIQLLARCSKSKKQVVFERYKDLDTKMASSSGFKLVWDGQVYPKGWKAK